MKAKKYLYAALGMQVAAAKSAQARIEDLVAKLNENASSASSDLKKRIDEWAGEGEQFLGKVTDTKAIDELTAKVDFDQVQSQVHRLRDQLEDIVSTWRANFRPEAAEKVTVTVPAEKVPAEKAPAEKAPADKAGADEARAEVPSSTKPAAKKPAAKPASKKPAAKKPAAKKPAARKPAAEKSTATRATTRKSTTKPAATTGTAATKAS